MRQRRGDGGPRDDLSTSSTSSYVSGRGVLVVDDDAEVVELLAEALAAEGYGVLRARDGAAALGNLSRVVAGFGPLSRIDVVVTDLVMPRVSGLELIRHIRARDALVPIVAMSAFADEALRTRAIRLGAAVVLHKPFFLDDLLDLVRRLAPTGPVG